MSEKRDSLKEFKTRLNEKLKRDEYKPYRKHRLLLMKTHASATAKPADDWRIYRDRVVAELAEKMPGKQTIGVRNDLKELLLLLNDQPKMHTKIRHRL